MATTPRCSRDAHGGRGGEVCSALLAVLLLVAASPAAADEPDPAEILFERGLAEMRVGRYGPGCAAIAGSYTLDPRAGTLFTLAECDGKQGHIATAARRYADYLLLFAKMPPEKQAKQFGRDKIANEKLAALVPQTPRLTLVLPPDAPKDTVVKVDGTVIDPAALTSSIAVDPGEHYVLTQLPGGRGFERRVVLRKAEKKAIVLELRPLEGAAPPGPPSAEPPPGASATPPVAPVAPPPPAPEPPPKPRGPPPSPQRVAAYVVGGVGLAGLVAGGVTGGLALVNLGVVEGRCAPRCDADGLSAITRAKTTATAGTIGLAAGGALLAVGLGLVLTEPRPPPGIAGLPAVRLAISREGALAGASWRW